MTHSVDSTQVTLEPLPEMKSAQHPHERHISIDTTASSHVHGPAGEFTRQSSRNSNGGSLPLSEEIIHPRLSFTQDVLESLHPSKQPSFSRSPLPNDHDNAITNPDVSPHPLNTDGPGITDGSSPTSTEPGPIQGGQVPPTQSPAYPSPAKTALVMFSLYISIFLVALDRTILGPAIPAITDEFGSIGDIGWYTSAYMLTACGFILPYGRIYTLFPSKPVFLSGIVLFEVGSAVCGAAPSSIVLIIGRAIQGLGSSAVFTGAILIMTKTVPLHRRPLLQGLFGACFGVASVVGPLLGGVFTGSRATWRWCFYVNLPIGGFTMIVVLLVLRLKERGRPGKTTSNWKETAKDLDPLGTVLFLAAITCLLLALQWGGAEYSWNAPRVIALLVVFSVLLIAFCVWQYVTRNTTATIPGRVLLQRSVVMGGISQFCVGAVMMTVATYIPLWFQAIQNVSAMQSGVDTIPLVLSVVFGSVASGGLVQRLGYYTPFMVAGSCLMATGAGLLITWYALSPTGAWIGFQVILGLGVGFTMQQPNLAVQVVLPTPDIATGTALLAVCQTLGGAVFVAVGQNLFLDKFTSALEAMGDGIDLALVVQSGATELKQIVPADLLPQVLDAYNVSLTRGPFFAALIVSCLGVPAALAMEWRSVKDDMHAKGDEESSSSSVLVEREQQRGDSNTRGIGEEKVTRDESASAPPGEEVREKK